MKKDMINVMQSYMHPETTQCVEEMYQLMDMLTYNDSYNVEMNESINHVYIIPLDYFYSKIFTSSEVRAILELCMFKITYDDEPDIDMLYEIFLTEHSKRHIDKSKFIIEYSRLELLLKSLNVNDALIIGYTLDYSGIVLWSI